jgi:hypothetical protein
MVWGSVPGSTVVVVVGAKVVVVVEVLVVADRTRTAWVGWVPRLASTR